VCVKLVRLDVKGARSEGSKPRERGSKVRVKGTVKMMTRRGEIE
jgi:hypothetical protein